MPRLIDSHGFLGCFLATSATGASSVISPQAQSWQGFGGLAPDWHHLCLSEVGSQGLERGGVGLTGLVGKSLFPPHSLSGERASSRGGFARSVPTLTLRPAQGGSRSAILLCLLHFFPRGRLFPEGASFFMAGLLHGRTEGGIPCGCTSRVSCPGPAEVLHLSSGASPPRSPLSSLLRAPPQLLRAPRGSRGSRSPC